MARNRRALAERTRIFTSQCVGSSSKRGRRRRTSWPYPTRGRAARAKRSGQARAGARGNARAHAAGRRRSRASTPAQSRSPEDGIRDCGIAAEVLSRFDVKLIFHQLRTGIGKPSRKWGSATRNRCASAGTTAASQPYPRSTSARSAARALLVVGNLGLGHESTVERQARAETPRRLVVGISGVRRSRPHDGQQRDLRQGANYT